MDAVDILKSEETSSSYYFSAADYDSFENTRFYDIENGRGLYYSTQEKLELSEVWNSYKKDLKDKKIKIQKVPSRLGWFEGDKRKNDIMYTFEKYLAAKKETEKNYYKFDKKNIYLLNQIKEEYLRKTPHSRTEEFREKWEKFEFDLENNIIPVSKKPASLRGWFEEESLYENIKYTFDNYKPDESVQRVKKNNIEDFKKKFPKLIYVYKKFMLEDDYQLEGILNDQLLEKNLPENEVFDILIEEAKRKYNFLKENYNEKLKDYPRLSRGMKEKMKEESELLDKFLKELKPIVEDFKSKNRARDESLRQKILEAEKPHLKKVKYSKYTRNETTDYIRRSIFLKKGTPFREFLESNGDHEKIFDIFKNYMIQNRNDLEDFIEKMNIRISKTGYKKSYEYMLNEVKNFYDTQKNFLDSKIKNYDSLSDWGKKEIDILKENLNGFSSELSPLLRGFDFKKEISQKELEKKKKDAELKKYNENIEDLEYKIADAQSKYSMNRAKLRKLDSRLKDLKILEKRRNELQEKLRLKNLTIEERKQILKEKTELNEKLKKIETLENQVGDLKSNFPDLSIFEQEKIARENELQKLKKLNDAAIREKSASFRIFELEKMKEEIRIREEQRYQQEQREKEELKQAKIVFLQEKKLVLRKLNILKTEQKYFDDRKKDVQKYEKEITEKKKDIQNLLSQTRTHLQNIKLESEQKRLKTLELQKKALDTKTDIAEQQKLFADSIQRDVNELNEQKTILKNITLENKKILTSVKKEMSLRENEIEKTLKLNLETIKQREAKILAEDAKIKLDVFTTLEDVKEQTALKLENERKLQELKDEIIRKEDVKNLLSETVEKIANQEISDAEEYNAFLDSEIEFKKKLSNTLLTQKQVLELLTEEKQSYLNLLKDTKSQFLQDILNAKRDIIEKNIKIALVEGKENLSYVTFGMKSEIEVLEKEKEINLRRKELANFQLENYNKELKLRKQEIDLLKNIRLKVLQTERLHRRNEAQSAISDMIKSIEKTERDTNVREKLDEMLDDVENKEINRKSKAALFSLIDKIEDKEIHDAAKEKLDFILGKIELHDNIDESKKALDKILDQIEDKSIRKGVEEKIDEILDDVELEDYDFLDEEDDFDNFLSNVRKHISGEKRMEQFTKIDEIFQETKKEDNKLKMEENIEMRERGRERIGPEDYEVGETSFAEFDDYNLFVQNIENPEMREKVRVILDKEDGFDKDKAPKMKSAYTKSINSLWQTDQLDNDYWDGNIILDENAKFLYEQKVNNLNTALAEYDLHVDPTDLNVRTFLDIKLQNTLSEKKGEINGYSYNGEKIISRNISRNFYFNYIKKPGLCQQFIDELKGKINNTARSQIASESFFDGRSVKDCALEYIGELREEQSYQMENARNGTEMKKALRDGNDIEKEIQNIKKNISFKMRLKIFRRTLSWRFTKLLRFLWKHKGKTAAGIFTFIATGIGILLNQLGVIAVVHNLKKASAAVKQYANDVHDMGKQIIQNVQAIYRVPGSIIGYTMIILSVFLRILYFTTRLTGTYSSAAVFGALGVTFEALVYFEESADKINEKVADAMEETGNVIEDFGIRAEKRIVKRMPKWYWDKPTSEKSVLEIIESGAAKMTLSFARGTQKAGKKVEEAGEAVRNSIWYLKIFVLITAIFMAIIFVRNYIL